VTSTTVDRADETEIDAVENSRDIEKILPDPGRASGSRRMDSNRFIGYSLSLNCRSTVVSLLSNGSGDELEWMNGLNGRPGLVVDPYTRPAGCMEMVFGLRPQPSSAPAGGPLDALALLQLCIRR
jgi:hypothetical protein